VQPQPPPTAAFVSRDGFVLGDEADEWLAENDPKHGRGRRRRGY